MEATSNQPAGPAGGSPLADPARAPGAVVQDPVIRSIIARKAAGEKLTAAENGKFGAFVAATGFKLPGRPPAAAQAPVTVDAASGGAAGLSAADSDAVRAAAAAIVGGVDSVAAQFLAGEARKAGADASTAEKFAARCRMPEATVKLCVASAPGLASSIGMDPVMIPYLGAGGGLVIWAGQIVLALQELKAMQAEKAAVEKRPENAPTK